MSSHLLAQPIVADRDLGGPLARVHTMVLVSCNAVRQALREVCKKFTCGLCCEYAQAVPALDFGRAIERAQFSLDARPEGYIVYDYDTYEITEYEPPESETKPELPHLSFFEWAHSGDPSIRHAAQRRSEMPVTFAKYDGTRGVGNTQQQRSGVAEKGQLPSCRPDFTALKHIGDSMGSVADTLEVYVPIPAVGCLCVDC